MDTCSFSGISLQHNGQLNYLVAYSQDLIVQWGINIQNNQESIHKIMSSAIASHHIYILTSHGTANSNIYVVNSMNQRIIWNKTIAMNSDCSYESTSLCSVFAINPKLETRMVLIQNTYNYSTHVLNLNLGYNDSLCIKCPIGTYLGK